MTKKILFSKYTLVLIIFIIFTTLVFILFRPNQEKTQITTDKITGDRGGGKIINGSNKSQKPGYLKTSSTLTYQSKILDSPKPQSNAVVLKWKQQGNTGQVVTAFRLFNGQQWSKWVESSSDDEAKDGAPISHAALVLGNQVHKVQYRFEITADNKTAFSPEVDLNSASIELIDTTKGPSPTKNTSVAGGVLQKIGLFNTASAQSGDPHIITRAEWGSPEPSSSNNWTPEYRQLNRVIVHHTAMATQGDSAAAVRAIWYFHTYTRGWGDIGYNYLVDQSGNIFQGRYYDQDYAEKNSVDVVGGHALEWNYGSSGIAALGDFTNSQPSDAMLNSIGTLAAFKLYRYGVDPLSWQGGLPAIVGHRDVMQTECPANVHQHLTTIRSIASSQYGYFANRPFETSDYDVVKGMSSPSVYLVQGGQLHAISTAGQRDCFVMAYSGRMRSVSEASIARMTVGSTAGTCSPPNYTWFYPQTGLQQYVLLYGGMYPVGVGDVLSLGGQNKARPLSDEGIQYLYDNYVSPQIPGHILVKGATQPAVYEANSDTLQHVTSPDTRDCLISQIGDVKNVPDSLISNYQTNGKISGTTSTCNITTGQILSPDGKTVAQISSSNKHYVTNPAIRDCIIGRTGTGNPYKVSQSVWDSFSDSTNAYCPYDSSIRFVKEASNPAVWRIFSDGTKLHADGFCVVDPFTTNLYQYHVWIVPDGETDGHTNVGIFNATVPNCAAIT